MIIKHLMITVSINDVKTPYYRAMHEIINQITQDYPQIQQHDITIEMFVYYWQKLHNINLIITPIKSEYNYLQWDTEQHYTMWLLKYS